MNPVIKGWWVGALGSYQQGHGYLHKINTRTGRHSYCPSGVLIDLYQRSNNTRLSVVEKKISTTLSIVIYEGNFTAMPPAVARWAGLENQYPAIVLNNHSWLISVLNDAGYGFDYIAMLIEKYL